MKKNYLVNCAITALAVCMVCCSSCDQDRRRQEITVQQVSEKDLIQENKRRVAVESDQIEAFIKRRKWNMNETHTGLRYEIFNPGDASNPLAKTGQIAKVDYRVFLIDGTLCYSTEKTGPQEFEIGKAHVESGLHEGITYMRVGDKAHMVLPSHLAHGLLGDDDKIPGSATIIYEIELLDLK